MKKLILQFASGALGIYLATLLLPQIKFAQPDTILLAALVLALLNMALRPLLIIITFPFNLLTLGFFTLVVNTWMVMLADAIVPGLDIPGFWSSLVVAIFAMIVHWVLKGIVHEKKQHRCYSC